MDDYLVVAAHAKNYDWLRVETTLVAINLRDYSIQKAQIDRDLFSSFPRCTFDRYKDNQIIKYNYGNSFNLDNIDWITIDSFERIHSRMSISNLIKPLK